MDAESPSVNGGGDDGCRGDGRAGGAVAYGGGRERGARPADRPARGYAGDARRAYVRGNASTAHARVRARGPP